MSSVFIENTGLAKAASHPLPQFVLKSTPCEVDSVISLTFQETRSSCEGTEAPRGEANCPW